jgi:hypothetical protein
MAMGGSKGAAPGMGHFVNQNRTIVKDSFCKSASFYLSGFEVNGSRTSPGASTV